MAYDPRVSNLGSGDESGFVKRTRDAADELTKLRSSLSDQSSARAADAMRSMAQEEQAKFHDVPWIAVRCQCGDEVCTAGNIEPSISSYNAFGSVNGTISFVTAEYIVGLHNSALMARKAAEDGTEAVRKEVREALTLVTDDVVHKAIEGVRVYGSEEGETEDVLASLAAFDSWVGHVRPIIARIVPWG